MATMVTIVATVILVQAVEKVVSLGPKTKQQRGGGGFGHTGKRHPIHLAHGARQGTDEADDQTDDAEDDGAGAVTSDGVEQHGESENVTGHQKDAEQQLAKE